MVVAKLKEYDNMFENVADAIEFMHRTRFTREVGVYDIDDKSAYSKVRQLFDEIKKYNIGKQLDIQVLPSNPFPFRGIKGCLGVQCYSILLGTYKENHECWSPFTEGYNESVLYTSDEEENVRPGMKALNSIYTLYKLAEEKCI